MTRRCSLATLVLTMALVGGCGGGPAGPEKVAKTFWQKIKSGGIQKAREHVTKASQDLINKGLQMSFEEGSCAFGEVKISGDHATVVTMDSEKKEKEQFHTVLVKEDGTWKVDLIQTLQSMMQNLPSSG